MKQLVLALSILAFGATAFAQKEILKKVAPKAAATVAAVATTVKFENKLVNGKKTWMPLNAKVKDGAVVAITLVNTLPEPHGFFIEGMTEQIVVNANETKTLPPITAKGKGSKKIKCQLHPDTHVGGVLIVE